MKILRRAVVAIVLVVALCYAYGASMPRDHVTSSRIQLTASRDSVWRVVHDFGAYPSWDSDFKSSVKGTPIDGHEVWDQDVGGMKMSVKFTKVTAPTQLITEIVTDEKSVWGGVWTYDVKDNGSGTIVTITEAGWISNPLLRVMMKAMGPHSTMDGLLKHLGAKFGEQVTPEHVNAAS